MNHQGLAAVFNSESRTFRLAEYPVAAPRKGEALLKLLRSGICGTDLHICGGKLAMPPGDHIIGHEFIGTVCSLGAGATTDGLGQAIAEDDVAIACVAIPCGQCFNCRNDETASCMNFGVTYVQNPEQAPHFFGGFAEYLHSPAANLVRVPPGLDPDAVAAAPCGGPTVIRAFAYGGGVIPGELAVVQGTGALGMFAIAWAAAHGAHVVAVGNGQLEVRRQLAMQLGAQKLLCIHSTTPQERLERLQELATERCSGNGVDMVIETSGAPDAVPEGIGWLRTRGRYLIPGQYSFSGAATIEPQLITFKALRIFGSGQYTLGDIGSYLEFLRAHPTVAATLSRCVTHSYAVRDISAAVEDVRAGRVIKAVFAG